MKNDLFYQKLVAKMNEVSQIPPQQVGPFTSIYKTIAPQLKFYPWKGTLVFSILVSLLLYILLGTTLIRLVSILQFGF